MAGIKRPSTSRGDGASGDLFGTAVALDESSGLQLAIGAPRHGAGGSWYGGVYVTEPGVDPTVQLYCFGDGGDNLGCTDCPCANNAEAGSLGGCLNGGGASAELRALGTASAAQDSLRFEVQGAVPVSFGILASSAMSLAGACPAGSGMTSNALDGLRCLSGGLARHGTRVIDANGAIGLSNAGFGSPSGGLLAQAGLAAGQTRNFQVTYRDNSNGSCGTGLNTTNAAAILVLP